MLSSRPLLLEAPRTTPPDDRMRSRKREPVEDLEDTEMESEGTLVAVRPPAGAVGGSR